MMQNVCAVQQFKTMNCHHFAPSVKMWGVEVIGADKDMSDIMKLNATECSTNTTTTQHPACL